MQNHFKNSGDVICLAESNYQDNVYPGEGINPSLISPRYRLISKAEGTLLPCLTTGLEGKTEFKTSQNLPKKHHFHCSCSTHAATTTLWVMGLKKQNKKTYIHRMMAVTQFQAMPSLDLSSNMDSMGYGILLKIKSYCCLCRYGSVGNLL